MSEQVHGAIVENGVVDARLDALRLAGADHFDPVRFHYLEALAHRVTAHQGSVKRILDDKLDEAVATLRGRLEHARRSVQMTPSAPEMAAAQGETLGDLVRSMAQHAPQNSDNSLGAFTTTQRIELKSVHYFRNTWSKLSAEKQVTQALGQAPKNAGPINSHMVALRSLALMRDISPDYLNHFMSYVDTLLCLEQGDSQPAPIAKKPRAVKPKP